MAHQWEPCLPGNEREAKIPFKLRENVKASPTYEWLQGGRNEYIPSGGWRKPEMLDFTLSSFSIKEAWILTQARWLFGGKSPPSSGFAGIMNKVDIPRPSNWFLDLLACCAASSRSLDKVTIRLNGEKFEASLLRLGTRQGFFSFTTAFQPHTGSSS